MAQWQVLKLAQLMLQYVLYGQEVLVRSNEQYTRSVAQLQHKYHVLHEQFKQRVQEIAQLKAERQHRKKATKQPHRRSETRRPSQRLVPTLRPP